MAEKYYWLSPYLYCANNPVNFIDPTGMDTWTLDSLGNVVSHEIHTEYDMVIVNGKDNVESKRQWEYGSITQLPDKEFKGKRCSSFQTYNDNVGKSLFELLADNSSVEWSILQTGEEGGTNTNYVSTSHEKVAEHSATAIIVDNIFDIVIRNAFHSHPNNIPYPSGLDWDEHKPGDVQFAQWVDSFNKKIKATYKIYIPKTKKYIEYHKESTNADFAY